MQDVGLFTLLDLHARRSAGEASRNIVGKTIAKSRSFGVTSGRYLATLGCRSGSSRLIGGSEMLVSV
jgi:hypothetical protein